jgi:PAS domain S-box-containing protein
MSRVDARPEGTPVGSSIASGDAGGPAAELCRRISILETALETVRVGVDSANAALDHRYRALMDVAQDAVFFTTVDGEIVDANRAALTMFRLTRDDLSRISVSTLYADPSDRSRGMQELNAHGVLNDIHVAMRRHDGEVFDASITAVARNDAHGRLVGYIGLVHDVTERRRAMRTLREDSAHYQGLFEQSSDGIILQNARGALFRLNPAACRMWAINHGDALPTTMFDLFGPSEHARVGGLLDMVRRDGRANAEYMGRRYDGTEFRAEISLTAAEIDGAHITQAIVRDVTARYEAERAIRASEALFRQLAENVDHVLWVCDREEGGAVYLSAAFEGIWGRPTSDLLAGKARFTDYVHPEDHQIIHDALEIQCGGTSTRTEYRILQPDGSMRWIRDTGAPLYDDHGAVYRHVGIAEDITERRRGEDQLRERTALVGMLFTELDHRVRNTLMSLISLIDVSKNSTRSVESFALILRERVVAIARIHDMLSASHWQPVCILRVLDAMRPHHVPGRIESNGPAFPLPPAQLNAFGMVMHELFTNSMKYGALRVPGGAVDISWTVEESGSFTLYWTERGGPRIETEPTPGLGTQLIQGLASYDLAGSATLRYPVDGARHEIRCTFRPVSSELLHA